MDISLSGVFVVNWIGPTMIYPNVCMSVSIRAYGYEYYEMLLVYFYDFMIVSHLGDEVVIQICDFYQIKERSQGPPMR